MTPNHVPDIEGILLAGGESSRFGADKCVHPLGGSPLFTYPLRALQQVSATVTIVASAVGVEKFSAFATTIVDDEPRRGPVQALMQAAGHVGTGYFLVLPCDSPFVSIPTLNAMARKATREKLQACIACDSSGRVHPLIGCYSVSIADAARDLLGKGAASVRDLLLRLSDVYELVVDDRELVNINTAEQAAAAMMDHGN